MKLIILFFTLLNAASYFAQTKKENIAMLTAKYDSLTLIINNERSIHKQDIDNKTKVLDSLKLIQTKYTIELNSLKKDSTKVAFEILSKSSQLSYKLIEFKKNSEAIEKINVELSKKEESLDQLLKNESISNADLSQVNSQNLTETGLTSLPIDDNCKIRTDRFDAMLYPIKKSDFHSIDDRFDENLIKVHVGDLKYKNGSEIDITIHDEIVYFKNEPFTGVAFTNNEFYANGVWKKRGTYIEFHDGFQKGKNVCYYGDGKVESIYDGNNGRKISFDYKGNINSIREHGHDGSKINYFENGQIREVYHFYKMIDTMSGLTNSFPIEEYDINGNLLEKTEYHCDKWPLVKYRYNRNSTHSLSNNLKIEQWVEETEPYLHKYYLITKDVKKNIITNKVIMYRYIKENSIIVDIKDSIWHEGSRIVEYSYKLSLEAIKNNERRGDIGSIKNGVFLVIQSGIETVKGQYVDNKRQGEWIFRDVDGSIRCVANFDKGLLSGAYKFYYLDGKISLEGNYDASILKDNFRYGEYYEGSIIEYPTEGRQGQFISYTYDHINGPVKKIETYKNGELNGPYEIYQNGVLIEKGVKP
jgi:antitoxin component YwqK of YwqJK toxin-antitoxin module